MQPFAEPAEDGGRHRAGEPQRGSLRLKIRVRMDRERCAHDLGDNVAAQLRQRAGSETRGSK